MKLISFSAINNEKPVQSPRILEPLKLHNEKAGDIFVNTVENKDGYNRFRLEIKNSCGKPLAHEIVGIDKTTNIMTGYDILVEPEYRNRKYRFGELLRLLSVMLMRENNCPAIKITSKDTAVYFHGKYKFAPDNKRFDDRDKMLETIAQDKAAGFDDLSKKAENLQSAVKNSKDDSQKLRDLCVETNKLAKEYIERALQDDFPEKNHAFKTGMYMVLTKEAVEDNKDFFNNLYKKHGIDYTV